MNLSVDHLKEIADLTVRLTELRQNECKNLCIENFAPKLFTSLLEEHASFVGLTGNKKLETFVNTFIDELHRKWLDCNDAATVPSEIFDQIRRSAAAARQKADI